MLVSDQAFPFHNSANGVSEEAEVVPKMVPTATQCFAEVQDTLLTWPYFAGADDTFICVNPLPFQDSKSSVQPLGLP
jgi:hypothetical protein